MDGETSVLAGKRKRISHTITPQASKALQQVSEEEWKHLILDLGLYASSVSHRLTWRTGNAGNLPRGETVESIVSQAIEKLYAGERNWDPERDPDLGNYLRDVIDSLLSHLVTSFDNRGVKRIVKGKRMSLREIDETALSRDCSYNEWFAQNYPDPEEAVLAKERARADDRAIQLLIEECQGDGLLLKIIEALRCEDRVDKASFLAEHLGVSVKEIYAASKRLARKYAVVAERIRAEQAAGGQQ